MSASTALQAKESTIQRIDRHLKFTPGCHVHTAAWSGEEILSRVDHAIKDYLLGLKPDRRPPKVKVTSTLKPSDVTSLKQYLVWCLEQGHYTQACGVLLALDRSGGHVIEAAVVDDVLQYIEEQDSCHVIPPSLLISWAKVLQNKGDLHGAIRRLNTAKESLLQGEAFLHGDEEEVLRIQGECAQLAGLTLNKMCCWKSAVGPLVESVETLRRIAEGTANASAVSLEMTAKCLCAITHGDYMELKDTLGFQHDDRFYQAYSMCKEAATLAGISELLLTRVRNQACEALLKYSVQREDPAECVLQLVADEAKSSLQAHTSLHTLANREQFFQFVRSLFLLCLALDFSDSPQDRAFAECLEERARFLYGEYCKQLCENGFLLQKLDMTNMPEVVDVIIMVKKEFGLRTDLLDYSPKVSCKDLEKNGLAVTLGCHKKFLRSLAITPKMPSANGKAQINDNGEDTNGIRDEYFPPAPVPHRQEIGLPINPDDYAIPVYDVPLSIFQDLCGCKFTPSCSLASAQAHNDVSLAKAAAGNSPDLARAGNVEKRRGLTKDSDYGASIVLANTFLTTKLPEDYGTSESDDSGVGSSVESSRSSSNSSSLSNDRQHVINGSVKVSTGEPVASNTVKRARLLKFNPVTGLWTSQASLVFVGEPLPLDDKVKGNCRDALEVQFLHQDEVLGRYVGKRYKRQRPPSQYLQDITCQKTARFLVTLFNYALNDLRYDIQVVYVPVAHVQLLSCDGEVEDWLNVEPYLEGDFIKLTNNLAFCNNQGRTLATALTHFSHSVSSGRLMLVDLQGWLPREGRGVVYLTDPQFHTDNKTSLSSCDMGARGMQAFWETVHPQCNAICQALGLKRPEGTDIKSA